MAAHYCQTYSLLLVVRCDTHTSSQYTINANFHQKHQHLAVLPHRHGTPVSFRLSLHLCAMPAALGTKIPKQQAFQGQQNATTQRCLCWSFQTQENGALEVSSQTDMVAQFGLWFLVVRPLMFALFFFSKELPFLCTVGAFSPLFTWIMDVPLQTDTTLNPCSLPVW